MLLVRNAASLNPKTWRCSLVLFTPSCTVPPPSCVTCACCADLHHIRAPLVDLEVRGVPALQYFGGVIWQDEVFAKLNGGEPGGERGGGGPRALVFAPLSLCVCVCGGGGLSSGRMRCLQDSMEVNPGVLVRGRLCLPDPEGGYWLCVWVGG